MFAVLLKLIVLLPSGLRISLLEMRCANPRLTALSTERMTWPGPERPGPEPDRNAPAASAAFAVVK